MAKRNAEVALEPRPWREFLGLCVIIYPEGISRNGYSAKIVGMREAFFEM